MIAIKGLTMPKGCIKCPYFYRDWEEPRCRAKSRQGKNLPVSYCMVDGRKPNWCPLVEVKAGEQDE